MSGWSWMSTAFVGEVYGYDKQGAGYGYTHKRGYHPIVATRAETGEVLHIRAAQRVGEHVPWRAAVLRRADRESRSRGRQRDRGCCAPTRDSGTRKIMARLHAARAGRTRSGSACRTHVKAAIAAIPEPDWQPLEDYPEGGEAQIAQTMLGCQRLIVRRTRLVGAQAELWPDWRYHAFLTNRTDPARARRGRTPAARRGGTRDP